MNLLTKQQENNNQGDQHPARFQRTDQWLPVYSWLESLDNGELVKSKDITEWLDANPEVKEELSSRHSRYHLTHYVKKCHLKILKRKEKKVVVKQKRKKNSIAIFFFIKFSSVLTFLNLNQGLIRLSRETAMEVHKEFGEKHHNPTLSGIETLSIIVFIYDCLKLLLRFVSDVVSFLMF